MRGKLGKIGAKLRKNCRENGEKILVPRSCPIPSMHSVSEGCYTLLCKGHSTPWNAQEWSMLSDPSLPLWRVWVTSSLLLLQLGSPEVLHRAAGTLQPYPCCLNQTTMPCQWVHSLPYSAACVGWQIPHPVVTTALLSPDLESSQAQPAQMPSRLSSPTGQQQSSNFFLGLLRAPSHCLSMPWWVHPAKFTTKGLGGPSLEILGFSKGLHKPCLSRSSRASKEKSRAEH